MSHVIAVMRDSGDLPAVADGVCVESSTILYLGKNLDRNAAAAAAAPACFNGINTIATKRDRAMAYPVRCGIMAQRGCGRNIPCAMQLLAGYFDPKQKHTQPCLNTTELQALLPRPHQAS